MDIEKLSDLSKQWVEELHEIMEEFEELNFRFQMHRSKLELFTKNQEYMEIPSLEIYADKLIEEMHKNVNNRLRLDAEINHR